MKNNTILITFIWVVSFFTIQGQNHTVFHIGHSLVSPYMPAMVQTFGDSAVGVNHDYNYGIINGAPLFWTWDHHDECQGYQASTVNAKAELLSGNYSAFVMTEGVPWDPILPDFYAYADSFHSIAVQGNSAIQTYLYETWNCLNTGLPAGCMYDDGDTILWTDRIRRDIVTWEAVADTLSNRHPAAPPVLIVPAGQAFTRLKDSVDAGAVPGASEFFTDFFVDDIHPNDVGFYFIACVHFATIYEQSPVGLPEQTFNEWGGLFTPPTPDLALKLQEIAWESVCEYPASGVDCGLTNTLDAELLSQSIELFPNPVLDQFTIRGDLFNYSIDILDSVGQVYHHVTPSGNEATIDLNSIPSGLYFIRFVHLTHNSLRVEKILKQ